MKRGIDSRRTPHNVINSSLFVYRLVYSPVTRALEFEPQLSRVRLPEGEKKLRKLTSKGSPKESCGRITFCPGLPFALLRSAFASFCHTTTVGSKKATPLRTGNKTAPARSECLVTPGGEDQSESDAEQPWQPGQATGRPGIAGHRNSGQGARRECKYHAQPRNHKKKLTSCLSKRNERKTQSPGGQK